MTRQTVAFICVHNSCRSQIAEALGRYLASDVFDSVSAGTETKPQINQDAVRLMKQVYGIDMEKEGQYTSCFLIWIIMTSLYRWDAMFNVRLSEKISMITGSWKIQVESQMKTSCIR